MGLGLALIYLGTISSFAINFVFFYLVPLSIKDKLNSAQTLETEDTCGTTCMISIAAGALFLVTAIAMTVACWRFDKVHKVVRGKFSEDTQDLSAPLSDYVDRGVVLDNLQLNFDMTTALGENSEKYAVRQLN